MPIETKRLLLDRQYEKLLIAMNDQMKTDQMQIGRLAASLDALSPLKVLGRGYSMAQTADGKLLSSVKDTAVGDTVHLRLSDGALECRVEGVKRHGRKEKNDL